MASFTGRAARIANVTAFGVSGSSPTGLASDGTTLYMSNNRRFYSLNPTTSKATAIGTGLFGFIREFNPRGMTFHKGTLYLLGDLGLYIINPTTGVASFAIPSQPRNFGAGITTARGLASDGTNLYLLSSQILYTLDPTTVRATRVHSGNVLGSGITSAYGLEWDGTQLVFVDDSADALFTADRTTGRGTRIDSNISRFGNTNLYEPTDLAWHDNKLFLLSNGDDALYELQQSPPPEFTAPPRQTVLEGKAWTLDLSTVFTGATEYAFPQSYQRPAYLTLTGSTLSILVAPDVSKNTVITIPVVATSADGATTTENISLQVNALFNFTAEFSPALNPVLDNKSNRPVGVDAIAWDGETLFVASDALYKMRFYTASDFPDHPNHPNIGDPHNVEKIADFPANYAVRAMAWDGQNLLLVDSAGSLWNVDRKTAARTLVLALPDDVGFGGTTVEDLAWDGETLYMLSQRGVYTVNRTTGAFTRLVDIEKIAERNRKGALAWDGRNLLLYLQFDMPLEMGHDIFYEVNRTTGALTSRGRFENDFFNEGMVVTDSELYAVSFDSGIWKSRKVNAAPRFTAPTAAQSVSRGSYWDFDLDTVFSDGVYYRYPSDFQPPDYLKLNDNLLVIEDAPDFASDTLTRIKIDCSNHLGMASGTINLTIKHTDITNYNGEIVKIGTLPSYDELELEARCLFYDGTNLRLISKTRLYTLDKTDRLNVITHYATSVAMSDEVIDITKHGSTWYVLYRDEQHRRYLGTLDITTGKITRVGSVNNFGPVNESQAVNIASDGTTLYMIGRRRGSLFTLNLTTSVATFVTTLGFVPNVEAWFTYIDGKFRYSGGYNPSEFSVTTGTLSNFVRLGSSTAITTSLVTDGTLYYFLSPGPSGPLFSNNIRSSTSITVPGSLVDGQLTAHGFGIGTINGALYSDGENLYLLGGPNYRINLTTGVLTAILQKPNSAGIAGATLHQNRFIFADRTHLYSDISFNGGNFTFHVSDGFRIHFYGESYFGRPLLQFFQFGSLTDDEVLFYSSWGKFVLPKRSDTPDPKVVFPERFRRVDFRPQGWPTLRDCVFDGADLYYPTDTGTLERFERNRMRRKAIINLTDKTVDNPITINADFSVGMHKGKMYGWIKGGLYEFRTGPVLPVKRPPLFSQPSPATIKEGASWSLDLATLFTGATVYSFQAGFTVPDYLQLRGSVLGIATAPDVDMDTVLSILVQGANTDGITLGSIQLTIEDVPPGPPGPDPVDPTPVDPGVPMPTLPASLSPYSGSVSTSLLASVLGMDADDSYIYILVSAAINGVPSNTIHFFNRDGTIDKSVGIAYEQNRYGLTVVGTSFASWVVESDPREDRDASIQFFSDDGVLLETLDVNEPMPESGLDMNWTFGDLLYRERGDLLVSPAVDRRGGNRIVQVNRDTGSFSEIRQAAAQANAGGGAFYDGTSYFFCDKNGSNTVYRYDSGFAFAEALELGEDENMDTISAAYGCFSQGQLVFTDVFARKLYFFRTHVPPAARPQIVGPQQLFLQHHRYTGYFDIMRGRSRLVALAAKMIYQTALDFVQVDETIDLRENLQRIELVPFFTLPEVEVGDRLFVHEGEHDVRPEGFPDEGVYEIVGVVAAGDNQRQTFVCELIQS